jgi:23S rRNA (adenine2503-C2)-methyltransferase
MPSLNLKGFTLKELADFAISIGEPAYRGKQLFEWIYRREASSFDEMSSLSRPLRKTLADSASLASLASLSAQTSAADGTTKFLFALNDGRKIEAVLIPPRTAFTSSEAGREEEQLRHTLCVSTQVGCPLDCKFCATATMGFTRNLTTGEIVEQLAQARRLTGRRITNVVYMGMGEPLLNYESVMDSAEIMAAAMNIAARHITVSTAGWVPGILRMADERRKVKLAVSLHTLDEESRKLLMPVAERYPLDELLGAIEYYYSCVKRRVTFEYILFDGWNDGHRDCERLIRLARRIPCKVNIIPFHTIGFTHPSGIAAQLHATPPERIAAFVEKLREGRVTVFVRSSAGEDIAAACGQLAVTSGGRVARRSALRKVELA